MRTTNKLVVQNIRIHILENFAESADYTRNNGEPNATPLTELKKQIDYMRRNGRTIYQTALDYVERCSLLVYYGDVKEFLNNLGINETGKEYSDEKSWRLYCHLVAREITKLYLEA
jgi:hypothetical protein